MEEVEIDSAEKQEKPVTVEEIKKERKRAKRALERLNKMQHGFFSDFKAFISKGNVMQLAVAVIVGAAFTAIVTSLVNDIFMPFIGLLFKGTNIGELTVTFSNGFSIVYGRFILAVVNFLLVALILFIVIKAAGKIEKDLKALKKHAPAKAEEAAAPTLTKTEELLTEIKELLKAKETESSK